MQTFYLEQSLNLLLVLFFFLLLVEEHIIINSAGISLCVVIWWNNLRNFIVNVYHPFRWDKNVKCRSHKMFSEYNPREEKKNQHDLLLNVFGKPHSTIVIKQCRRKKYSRKNVTSLVIYVVAERVVYNILLQTRYTNALH